jgi:two-component system sensor histidine kinase MprB
MTLRGRVTLLATLVAAAALAGAAAATYVVVHDDVDGDALTHLRIVLAAGVVGGTLLAAVLARLYARRAVRPVAQLAATVGHVRETGNVARRLHAEAGDRELGRLAAELDALLRALERSRDAERRLIADASQELRAPVAGLRESVERVAGPDSELAAQARELGELVGDLLELARDGEMPLEAERVALDEIVRAAIDGAGNRVRYDADLEPGAVEGSAYRLGRAVANLLGNAADHSPPGGVVEVVLRGGELTVRDFGPGIPPDELPHVFDRFYRGAASRGRPGSGLGLAIVRQVAEQHGGTVAAEHPPDGGALFRLRLPATRGRA